jgi:predicted Zn-dependent protease
MISELITLEGHYFNGDQPIDVPAVLTFEGKEAILFVSETSERYPILRLSISPRICGADRFITLPNGAQFQCAHHAILDSLPQESPTEGFVVWLEERLGIALASVAIVAVLLVVSYFYGLPAAANYVVSRMPIETERALGKQTLVWLDSNKWFNPTNLAQDKRKSISDGFTVLCSDLPLKDYYQLEFRDAPFIGANALALPGGIIVITDDMIKVAESTEEVLAVLAHEIGHVELRHTMKSILQNSAVALVATTVTSDAASLSVAVAGLPTLIARTKYSRDFESAADDYTFRLLKKKNYSPAHFASIMERLDKKRGENHHIFAFVSTHPITEERIKRARAAANEK